jgi:hypothetical protein
VEEGPGTLEGAAEGRLQMRVQGLGRLFRGRQGVGAEVHPVAAEAGPCLVRLVRLVRQKVEPELPQP